MTDEQVEWEWQRVILENILSKIDGDAFETKFQELAKAKYGALFTPTIPMGSRGDLKCDGFHSGKGCVYQCYGPRYGQADVNDALKKVDEDFRGAKKHWGEKLKLWTFVVGLYRDKVPSEIIRLIEELSIELEVPYEIMTRDDIIRFAKGIELEERVRLIGRAPQRDDMVQRVTYANIGKALKYIRTAIAIDSVDRIPLPPDVGAKIKSNELSPTVRHYLETGQTASDRVSSYLLDQCDPREAEQMSEGFTQRYKDLKRRAFEPDQIFAQMIHYAGGGTGDPDRDTAALAIVTHYFTTCEIFDRPESETAQ